MKKVDSLVMKKIMQIEEATKDDDLFISPYGILYSIKRFVGNSKTSKRREMKKLRELIDAKDFAAAKAMIIEHRDEIEDIADTLLSIIDRQGGRSGRSNVNIYDEFFVHYAQEYWDVDKMLPNLEVFKKEKNPVTYTEENSDATTGGIRSFLTTNIPQPKREVFGKYGRNPKGNLGCS